jgi:hypothetical protein
MHHVRPAVRGLGVLLLSAAVLAVGLCAAANAEIPQRFLEYLYVEANSGDSSGGHAAICFEDWCYHFQQDEEQTIRLHRVVAVEFDYRYRLLGNRTIHATRVDVSPDTYDRLRAAFQARFQVEERQYDLLQSLTRDRQLLEQIGDCAAEPRAATIRVPGSAYFVADARDAAAPGTIGSGRPVSGGSPGRAVAGMDAGATVFESQARGTERAATIERLADRVSATYGDAFIERRAATLRAAIMQLVPLPAVDILPEAGRLPVFPAGFAIRYGELLDAWLALEVLRTAKPLRAGTFHAPADADFALQSAETDVFRGYATQLTEALVRLPVSERPDWGYPMLVGMARLLALEISIDWGRLVFLDDFPEDATTIAPDAVSRHAATLTQVREERQADFLAARRAFFESPSREEIAFSELETTGNLLVDVDEALVQNAPLRVYTAEVVPTKSAIRSDWPLPELSDVARGYTTAARQRESAYRAALAVLHHYDLFSHNCVTEIFRTMEPALTSVTSGAAPNADAVRAASTAALGGYVEWRRTLNFIPFLSAGAVGRAYRVSERVERPSSRRVKLEHMYQRETALRVDLRESNVLTARSYERSDDDPLFLFFTDDVVARRPLYGIANLAVGIGGTLAGVVLWPADRGATLRAALDGALFSLPELAFINIRKGSFAFAPRDWLGDGFGPEQPAPLEQRKHALAHRLPDRNNIRLAQRRGLAKAKLRPSLTLSLPDGSSRAAPRAWPGAG